MSPEEEQNEWGGRCAECGAPCHPEEQVCLYCNQRGQEVEDRVNEAIERAYNDERQGVLDI
jgi:uncharacterized OB-fold protein